MAKVWAYLDGKKTYLVAGATILYALLGLALHFIDAKTAIQLILGSLGLGALRNAIN